VRDVHVQCLCSSRGGWDDAANVFVCGRKDPGAQVAPARYEEVATIPLGLGIGLGGTDVAVNPVTGLVYVVNDYSGDVSIISGTEVITMVVVGDEPRVVAVDPDTGLVYVSNHRSRDITILSGTATIASVETGCWSFDIAANPANGLVYTAHGSCGTVTVLSPVSVASFLVPPNSEFGGKTWGQKP
jgi:DNA-binding beta-propeller fold protein YncE